jgi:hypothetical protein
MHKPVRGGWQSLTGDSTVVAFFYGRFGVASLGNTPYVPGKALPAAPHGLFRIMGQVGNYLGWFRL